MIFACRRKTIRGCSGARCWSRLHAVSLNFRDIAMLRRFRPGGDRRVREASRGVETHGGRLVRHVFLRRGRIFWQKSREEFLKEVRAEMEASK